MPLINHNISNLIGGVSRQPSEARFDNQVEEMINFEPYITGSIRKRNPLESVATISTHQTNMAIHSYDRGDGLEKYGMILDDNGLRVYDVLGNQKTVNVIGSNPLTKWSGSDWTKDASFLTVGDTTWVLNKNQVVSMTDSLSPKLRIRDRAFYWIKRSFDDGQGSGYDYTITLNGVTFSINSISSDTAAISLSDLINQQYATLDNDASLFPDYIRATAIGSIVYIYIASIYAPTFRNNLVVYPLTGTGDTYVRVQDSITGIVSGVDVLDYETSFKIIGGDYKLYCSIGGVVGYYDLTLQEMSLEMIVYYYNSASKAKNNVSPVSLAVMLYQTIGDEELIFNSSDSWGEQASIGWKDSVAKIGDLPSSMDGFKTTNVGIVEITGTDRNEFTSYYLKWEDDRWAETMLGGLEDTLDATTLPAKLVRVSDGSFTFGFNEDFDDEGFTTEWVTRLKGDDDSNPLPSFVGYSISNMFFFRNRLGLTAEENVILSEVGDYYNFFATTVLEVLDGDTIDVSVDSDTVSNIRNVNAVSGSLTLWSDNAQFVLSGGEILSPLTTRVAKTSSYACDNSIPPVLVDNEVIFFNKIGGYLEVMAYSASSLNTDNSSAESISTNVLGYLPSSINKAVVASASNMLFLLDEDDSKTMYVYKYHISKNEKIMSSWFKWTFDYDIKEFDVLDNVLFLLIDTNGLAKIELNIRDLDNSYLDMGVSSYKSEVLTSKFNLETKQGTRIIREPFYIKNMKISYEGTCDLQIIDDERSKTKTIKNKFLTRRLFVGGNSNKTSLGFVSEYDVGCKINTISLEGIYKARSKNV